MTFFSGNKHKGSYSVEAVLSLTVFLVSVLSLTSYISVIRVETAVQNALNRTVAEITGYCYIADKIIGLPEGDSKLSDDISAAVTSFSDLLKAPSDGVDNVPSEAVRDKLTGLKNAYGSVKKMSGDIDVLLSSEENKDSDAVTVIISALLEEELRKAGGRIAGSVLCRLLADTYLPPSEKLESMGIRNGTGGIKYGLSSVLSDGKTVRLVAVYEVEYLFGIIPPRTVCQEASGHAWLAGDDCETVSSGSDIWSSEAKSRGKRFVNMVKDENPSLAVKEGTGFDLYSDIDKRIISVHSVNVFASTYSAFSPPAPDSEVTAGNYKLNKSQIRSCISGLASKLKNNCEKVRGREIKMTSGAIYKIGGNNAVLLLIILPLDADTPENRAILGEISNEILKKYSVGVTYEYRYNALD